MPDEYASVPKKRKFFALVQDLGYDADFMKDRAKRKFNLSSFRWILDWQIKELIDIMQNKLDTQYEPCTHCKGTGFMKRDKV